MPNNRKRMSYSSRKEKNKKRKSSGKIIASDDAGAYYEIEAILDYRTAKGVDQYLIKWVDYDEPTWEFEEALCNSAYDDAMRVKQAKRDSEFLTNATLTAESDTVAAEPVEEVYEVDVDPEQIDETPEVEEVESIEDIEDKTIDWTETSQIEYRPIERVSVHENGVAQRVKAAREAGVPLCLVGHVGWAQFAQPWLSKVSNHKANPAVDERGDDTQPPRFNSVSIEDEKSAKEPVRQEEQAFLPNDEQSSLPADGDLIDLSDSYVLDVQRMIDCIGNENVPIQRKSDKLGDDPNQHRVSLKFFVEKCWPEPGKELAPAMAARYLHQWQFPLSETAVPKLCNKCNPLPNGILGMDLLRLWHDREQFQGDSPYQYIFMGNKGTMSRLHSDRGGLMITIAPIIGEKEVVLVHRSDGNTSLYDLEGDLEKPDIHHYPLLPTARVWKTVVKPGEILIMPHSTYHQCRNLTPCLSYSRFYLDDVNLKAFLQSFMDRDALELDHADLLWNVCFELHTELTNYSDGARRTWMLDRTTEEVPPRIVKMVSMLKKLRNAARHVEIHYIRVADSVHGDWKKMVLDIDNTLHNYRYRYFLKQPRITRKMCRYTKKEQQREDPPTSPEIKTPLNCPLHLYRNQEKIGPEDEGNVVCDSLVFKAGDHVGIKDHGYYCKGVIKEVRNDLKAAFVKFTEFSEICSQYLPFDYLRNDVSDEALPPTFTPLNGSSVYYKESGRSYPARIQSWRCGTLYKLTIELDDGQCFDRWFPRESFVRKIASKNTEAEELHTV